MGEKNILENLSFGLLARSGAEVAPNAGEDAVSFGELDIVKIVTDAYADEGLVAGEEGTVVLVHGADGETAYEVEFDGWEKMFPVKVKALAGSAIELVERWRGQKNAGDAGACFPG